MKGEREASSSWGLLPPHYRKHKEKIRRKGTAVVTVVERILAPFLSRTCSAGILPDYLPPCFFTARVFFVRSGSHIVHVFRLLCMAICERAGTMSVVLSLFS